MNKTRVILPGSYDPVTIGHLDIIKRAAEKYDEVYVVVFINPDKEYAFSLEERVKMLIIATEEFSNVIVSYSLGLVIDYMREHGIEKIIKGYRNETDLAYEQMQADWNLKHGGYETELWLSSPEYSAVSSTAAREAIKSGAPLGDLLARGVIDYINSKNED